MTRGRALPVLRRGVGCDVSKEWLLFDKVMWLLPLLFEPNDNGGRSMVRSGDMASWKDVALPGRAGLAGLWVAMTAEYMEKAEDMTKDRQEELRVSARNSGYKNGFLYPNADQCTIDQNICQN